MNPFASIDEFEALRRAALTGAHAYESYTQRQLRGDRRAAGRSVALRLGERTRRMTRLAVASYKSVLLVGPPGTGKTEIIEQLIEDVREDPSSFGLGLATVDDAWVTPEEEWTFENIVLGQTVIDGHIQSVEGSLLRAINQNQWLVFDETNRADMDKVLGGVLTWLTDKRVRVGDWVEHGKGSVPVYLDWSRDSDSRLVLTGEGREYLAGQDFRLLGTYNPVDAQRVFRMGQALSRRFKHVPIPPASIAEFQAIIEGRVEMAELVATLVPRVSAIYSAHLAMPETEIGPGLLVDLPRYVETGIRFPALGSGAPDHSSETTEAETAMVGASESIESEATSPSEASVEASPEAALGKLVAEGYVLCVGGFLAKRSDDLAALGQRMLALGAFDGGEWDWISGEVTALRAR